MSRAALYDRTGGPDVLYVGEVPDPDAAAGKVVVRVRAAGLNPYDGKVRSGFIPLTTPFPRRVGADFAGRVEAVGEGAVYWDGTPIARGDEVYGRAAGAVAERAVASASGITRRPEALPAEVAAGLNVSGLTALSCRVTVPVDGDDVVLVGGAAGSVGFLAAQLARAAGARVIGTASERNHDMLREVGIEPVEYGDGLVERLEEFGPFTAVYDCHGRGALDAGVALGVPVGRMVAIAAYGAIAELGVHDVERAARTAENLDWIGEDVAAGRLVAPVAATYPLDRVAEAFAALEGTHPAGKIVVTP